MPATWWPGSWQPITIVCTRLDRRPHSRTMEITTAVPPIAVPEPDVNLLSSASGSIDLAA